jgi:UDP-2,4-diacetamido-2,4,6-trideoxy-beta-L-altropyranose hydrolase
MQVAFRVDASLQIGTGHVVRCLTLADALRERGAQCTFFCRPHSGHLLALVAQRGHKVVALPELQEVAGPNRSRTAHGQWLGTDWAIDAQDTEQTLSVHMAGRRVDLLVVDHYALDVCWEQALRPQAKRIMVIDDLADRPHACDVLLDQTYGRQEADYLGLVTKECTLLCGARFALLRPEFAALREYSLRRRRQPVMKELFINMGGVDKDNVTGAVLRALNSIPLPEDCRLTVVMGQTAPWLKDVQDLTNEIPRPTQVLVGVDNMAQLMAESDLAIGAAGATSWERCCLGLPSIVMETAENQKLIMSNLIDSGSVISVAIDRLNCELKQIVKFCSNTDGLLKLSSLSSIVTDGQGVQRTINFIHE